MSAKSLKYLCVVFQRCTCFSFLALCINVRKHSIVAVGFTLNQIASKFNNLSKYVTYINELEIVTNYVHNTCIWSQGAHMLESCIYCFVFGLIYQWYSLIIFKKKHWIHFEYIHISHLLEEMITKTFINLFNLV